MDTPYTVEVEQNGCERCGSGREWVVVGPDGIALGQTWSDKNEADELAERMNEAREFANSALRSLAQTLVEALGKYGGHLGACSSPYSAGQFRCDCGFDATLSAAAEMGIKPAKGT